MPLESFHPPTSWEEGDHAEAIAIFRGLRATITVHVWGADWCPDTRRELPSVAAVLEAAGVPASAIHLHEVDENKDGPCTAEYGIERIPTVVIEHEGEEIARFVEREADSAPNVLADQLEAVASAR